MARPQKDGLGYFPLDVDFLEDKGVKLVKSQFGAKGIAVLIILLCEIYRDHGCYKRWDGDDCLLVSDQLGAACGCGPKAVAEIVEGCVRRALFDKDLFDTHGVLTSAGIQRRFVRAASDRAFIRVPEEFWLLSESDEKDVPAGVRGKLAFYKALPEENRGSQPENPLNTAINPQRKEKKKKRELQQRNECAEALIFLPLNDGRKYPVTSEQAGRWKSLYPAVDVEQQLRGICGWLEASPANQKTEKGIARFINNWLAREQNRTRPPAGRVKRIEECPPTFDAEEFTRWSENLIYGKGKKDG